MKHDEKHSCLSGVCCSVSNCIHNENGCKCIAEQIDVENKSASDKVETYCNTFAPKDNCCR